VTITRVLCPDHGVPKKDNPCRFNMCQTAYDINKQLELEMQRAFDGN
jgi:hypothetical protein